VVKLDPVLMAQRAELSEQQVPQPDE